MVASHVRGHEPLHPPTEVAVVVGPQDKVEVVGHQTVAGDAHGQPLVGLLHQSEERAEVLVLMNHIAPSVASIERVIDIISLRRSGGPWHAG